MPCIISTHISWTLFPFVCFRITLTAQCDMDLRLYPMDTQYCPLIIESCMYLAVCNLCMAMFSNRMSPYCIFRGTLTSIMEAEHIN